MNQTYIRQLLNDLAVKIGRTSQDMEPFIKKFEGQWYDNKQALKKLKPDDYARLQIPERLAMMITEAVGAQWYQNQKMDIESPIEGSLAAVKTKVNSSDFDIIVSTMHKIFNNIRQNLITEKYKTLKKSNQKISVILSLRELVDVLRYGGFQDKGEAFVMTKINLETIDECIGSITKFMPQSKFDPFKSHIISNGQTTVQNYQGSSSVEYNKMLNDLENQRTKIMSQPIRDRKIKVYQIQPHYLKEFDRQFQEEKEGQDEDKHFEMEQLKKALKRQGEEPKFVNKRMQEYQELVKQPVFSETVIRVKLQDNWIFQCRFSPMETLEVLVGAFQQCLNNPNIDYYLYMTPPVQKLSGVLLRKTFYDLGCVPRAIFYMKCQQQLQGNIFKMGKTAMKF